MASMYKQGVFDACMSLGINPYRTKVAAIGLLATGAKAAKAAFTGFKSLAPKLFGVKNFGSAKNIGLAAGKTAVGFNPAGMTQHGASTAYNKIRRPKISVGSSQHWTPSYNFGQPRPATGMATSMAANYTRPNTYGFPPS